MEIAAGIEDRIKEAVNSVVPSRYASMAAFAREIGVTKSALSQWISGKTKSLKGDSLYSLAQGTGYSAKWIIENIPPKMQADYKSSRIDFSVEEDPLEIGELRVCDISVAELIKYIKAAG